MSFFAVRRLAKRATIYNIVSEMRENYADVIYLACHGMLTDDGGPRLLLENEDGLGEMVKGEQLVERLSGSQERPRMVILASCQSAEAREDDGLVALAPRLALSGVPNVLAMQGDITMESVARFIPRLFGELADRDVVWQQLVDRGVLVRQVGPPGWLRVSIGTAGEMAAFRAALSEVLSEVVPA